MSWGDPSMPLLTAAREMLGNKSAAPISRRFSFFIGLFLLARACREANEDLTVLPGPTAFVPAIINSGLPCERFCFEGFLPQKKGRATRLGKLKEEERTMIFYESPFRLIKTLQQFIEVFGEERQASVSREISKMFEENKRGTILDCLNHFSNKTVKGEIVIVVAGKKNNSDQ